MHPPAASSATADTPPTDRTGFRGTHATLIGTGRGMARTQSLATPHHPDQAGTVKPAASVMNSRNSCARKWTELRYHVMLSYEQLLDLTPPKDLSDDDLQLWWQKQICEPDGTLIMDDE